MSLSGCHVILMTSYQAKGDNHLCIPTSTPLLLSSPCFNLFWGIKSTNRKTKTSLYGKHISYILWVVSTRSCLRVLQPIKLDTSCHLFSPFFSSRAGVTTPTWTLFPSMGDLFPFFYTHTHADTYIDVYHLHNSQLVMPSFLCIHTMYFLSFVTQLYQNKNIRYCLVEINSIYLHPLFTCIKYCCHCF